MLKRYLRELYGEKYTYVCEEMFEGIMDAIFGIISNNDYDKITDGMPIYAGFTVYKLNRYDDMYEILAPISAITTPPPPSRQTLPNLFWSSTDRRLWCRDWA